MSGVGSKVCEHSGRVCRHVRLRLAPETGKVKLTPVAFRADGVSELLHLCSFPSPTVTLLSTYDVTHTLFTGVTRTLCPLVNLGSRFRPIVIEVAL